MSTKLPKCIGIDHFINEFNATCFLPSTTDVPLNKRLLNTEPLWEEVKELIFPKEGYLIINYAEKSRLYSKNADIACYREHYTTFNTFNLITLLWTDGLNIFPIDFRIYDIDQDNKTKNDHCRDMLDKAQERGFEPDIIVSNSWNAGIQDFKAIRKKKWHFLTRLKSNRLVKSNGYCGKSLPVGKINIPL